MAKETEPTERPAPRGELDPITKHLWRYPRPERNRLLMPFVGHRVRCETWPLRVSSGGDHIYNGVLLAVATTTTGTTADFAIVQTIEGNVWAISTAQIAYFERVKK